MKTDDRTRDDKDTLLSALDTVLKERLHGDADSSYVASLYAQGTNKILEKIGEEATEVILAAKDHANVMKSGHTETSGTARAAVVGEVADLWFHSMVLLTAQGLSSADVLACLESRFGLSGHDEKAARNTHKHATKN